jgi:carbonic anhydrase/acetyltransferase-like protein (isoleucine patch superfamily)
MPLKPIYVQKRVWQGLAADQHGDMKLEERLLKYLTREPVIDPGAYVAPSAVVMGSVRIGPKASVWPTCVLRGDIEDIEIGEGSNVQDGSVVHLADDLGVKVGKYVTIGHMAMIHACTIEDECLIGMKATVLDGAVIGKRSIVGAGAVVTKNMQVPPGSLVLGMPAKVVKQLSDEEQASLRGWAEKYVEVAAFHKAREEARQ